MASSCRSASIHPTLGSMTRSAAPAASIGRGPGSRWPARSASVCGWPRPSPLTSLAVTGSSRACRRFSPTTDCRLRTCWCGRWPTKGAARAGVELHLEDLAPEPTLTVDGAWWHPACVTNPSMRVADTPLPLSDVLETIAATVHVTQAAASRGRTVFRCT